MTGVRVAGCEIVERKWESERRLSREAAVGKEREKSVIRSENEAAKGVVAHSYGTDGHKFKSLLFIWLLFSLPFTRNQPGEYLRSTRAFWRETLHVFSRAGCVDFAGELKAKECSPPFSESTSLDFHDKQLATDFCREKKKIHFL